MEKPAPGKGQVEEPAPGGGQVDVVIGKIQQAEKTVPGQGQQAEFAGIGELKERGLKAV